MAGFVFAFALVGFLWLAVDIGQWLVTHDPVAAFADWWTTPVTVTPADVAWQLFGVVGIVLVLAIFWMLNQYASGVRA